MPDRTLVDVARYRVLFADCDPMRVMYNGTYFRLFGIGWTELFRSLGHPLPGFMARGLFLAVVKAKCRYLKPARYDDDLLLRCAVSTVGAARLVIDHEVVRGEGELLARGLTAHVMVNGQNRPQRMPDEIKRAVESMRAGLTQV